MEITGDLCGVFSKMILNDEKNLTCITVMSQCNQYVATVIKRKTDTCVTVCDWWLISHNQKLLWLWYKLHVHVGKVTDHVNWHVQNLRSGGGSHSLI